MTNPPQPALVFVHYRLPEQRLIDHFEWNADLYRAADARVFVVCDPETAALSVPPCLQPPASSLKPVLLPYPGPMPIFSLAKTKNFGIRAAIDAGHDPIIATDADIAFPPDAMAELLQVEEGQAVAPVYQMVHTYQTRHRMTGRIQADLAIGTISMRASGWLAVHGYNELMEGYGCDDGEIWARMGNAKIERFRGLGCYHIAHVAGSVQQEAHTAGDKSHGVREDHWNRENGFNPRRFRENRKAARRVPWRCAEWGRPK